MNINRLLKKISYSIFGVLIATSLPMAVYYGVEYFHTRPEGLDPSNELGKLFRERFELEKKIEKLRIIQCSLIDTKECELIKHADKVKENVGDLEKKFKEAQLAYDKKAIELDCKAEKEERSFFRKIFLVSILVSILAFIVSLFISIVGISVGCAVGGIFTLLMGGYSYWDYLHPGIKFITLFTLLVLLLSLSYRISKLRSQ